MSAIAHRRANGSVIAAESYAYDAGGNLTYKVVDGVRTDYAYDAIDQLTSEATPGWTTAYAYDANGNRLTKTVNGTVETYAYDDGDRLLSRSGAGGTFGYGYDACGRTRTVQAPGGTTTLTYDYEDRLTNIVGPGVNAAYAYNGADARVGKSGTGGSRAYRRDGVGVTAPVLGDGVRTMVPGISERSGGATAFSHLDRLGTSAKTTDASGGVVDAKAYDAFGLPRAFANPSGSQRGFASAFGYQEDAESGLKLLGHRYYDSATGRFITRDPIGSGTNWYRYCDNNPLKQVDPDGYQIRDLNDQERGQVQNAIDFMRSQGEAQAADSLQDKLNRGRIKVDASENGTHMETDADGKTIYIHLSTFGNEVLGSRINDRRDPIRNKSFIRANQIYFSSLLFHEWVHTTQGRYWKAYHPNVAEQNAWAMQANFIVRYLNRMDHGIVRGSFKDFVREFMQEFWGTAIGNYHDYGGVGP